ncbi:MAG: hypothetical protein FJY11_01315 [Bacteroidetes bacterium]|nr:hypothetical protein [Bacteroidota bacterium]
MKTTEPGYFILATLAAAFMVTGCIEIEQLPPEPRIEFRSFTISDTTDILGNEAKAGKLTFYFEDGDGDIGLREGSAYATENYNMFLTLYRKSGGIMLPADGDDPLYPTPYRIPYLERLGQNKILKGEISVTILYLFYSESDTIMYDFYIRDRAQHESNVESTCVIAVAANGTCTAGS